MRRPTCLMTTSSQPSAKYTQMPHWRSPGAIVYT